jgi:hypothetical protein
MEKIIFEGLYNSLYIDRAIKSKPTRYADNIAFMENLQKILAGESECKRPLERPSCGWQDVKAVVKVGGYGLLAGLIWFGVASKVGIL